MFYFKTLKFSSQVNWRFNLHAVYRVLLVLFLEVISFVIIKSRGAGGIRAWCVQYIGKLWDGKLCEVYTELVYTWINRVDLQIFL